jgi:hypothetical protein
MTVLTKPAALTTPYYCFIVRSCEDRKTQRCSIMVQQEKFLQMGKSVRNVEISDIYTNIIPIYYLSKVTGLAPLSLADTQR